MIDDIMEVFGFEPLMGRSTGVFIKHLDVDYPPFGSFEAEVRAEVEGLNDDGCSAVIKLEADVRRHDDGRELKAKAEYDVVWGDCAHRHLDGAVDGSLTLREQLAVFYLIHGGHAYGGRVAVSPVDGRTFYSLGNILIFVR